VCLQASRVVELRSELYNESVEVVQQEDSDYDDSEMEETEWTQLRLPWLSSLTVKVLVC